MQRTYVKNEVAWFYRKSGPNWTLSNMAGGMPVYWPMVVAPENLWRSSEHLYQAAKYGSGVRIVPASNPGADPCVRNRIRAQRGPRGAKMTQKCAVAAGLVREDWEAEEVRLLAMTWVIEVKLACNPEAFGSALADTGDKDIVEISTKDRFWGCVESSDGTVVGQNNLGRILMDVRGRMAAVLAGEFSHPDGFLLP